MQSRDASPESTIRLTQFSEMPLSADLQRKLALANFTIPTAIQAETIPHALAGRDILATAQTGTGKTLAFLVPLIERLLQTSSRNPEALILVPTPGRLEDFLGRRLVRLEQVKTLILDEADRMLDMGFLPAIRRIVAVLPRDRQTMCFSATLEASVAGLVNDYMRSPVRIAQGSISKPADTVELHAFEVSLSEKSEVLRQLLYAEKGRPLVFARTKRGTERLAKGLMRDGFAAAMIHGDRTQSQRTGALAGFDAGRFKVLVATDVASRGIDVQNIAHVINYDLPAIPEDF